MHASLPKAYTQWRPVGCAGSQHCSRLYKQRDYKRAITNKNRSATAQRPVRRRSNKPTRGLRNYHGIPAPCFSSREDIYSARRENFTTSRVRAAHALLRLPYTSAQDVISARACKCDDENLRVLLLHRGVYAAGRYYYPAKSEREQRGSALTWAPRVRAILMTRNTRAQWAARVRFLTGRKMRVRGFPRMRAGGGLVCGYVCVYAGKKKTLY